MKTILITGGAGFIGQKLSFNLIKNGYKIRIYDNLSPQVHNGNDLPDYIKNHADIYEADIRDKDKLRQALVGVDCVVHFAAETGTGQSMYEIEKYFSVNVQGTATLVDLIQNDPAGKNIKKIIVASSRSIYGEGLYKCKVHGDFYPPKRNDIDVLNGNFDFHCKLCNERLLSFATPESAILNPISFYAITKQTQEEMILLFAKTKGINGFALRYQNVYGPGQSLKNPYTGILAVFSSLARSNMPLNIFEDGEESRDFIYIDDVVDATISAINFHQNFVGPLNIGSGTRTNVLTLAKKIKDYFLSQSPINISGEFRRGDIRHNSANIELAENLLNFKPKVNIDDGLKKFLDWVRNEKIDNLAYDKSIDELNKYNLLIKSTKQ